MSRRKKTYTDYEIIKNIAKILVLHRVWNGLSQTNIAKDLNVSFQQVQKYEKCINEISWGKGVNLCNKRKWDITLFQSNKPESILDEWMKGVNQMDPQSSPYPLRISKIIEIWKIIDKDGKNNYYHKHHFTKGD